MTTADAHIRFDICRDCKRACEVRATINHADPCTACPLRVWHRHSACDQIDTPPEHPTSTSSPSKVVAHRKSCSLLRRFRAYLRSGFPLVDAKTRRLRRDACSTCELRKESSHNGLYGCASRSCGCIGGDELRMAYPNAKCALLKWPIPPTNPILTHP